MRVSEVVDWNRRYLNRDTPWVHDLPVKNIASTIEKYVPTGSRLLEIGCGYGVESIELAHLGYNVTGFDISQAAIEYAKVQAGIENVAIDFQACDAMLEPIGATYDAVLDIAVFPRYGLSGQAEKYIEMISQQISEHGYWFSMVFFADDVAAQAKKTGNLPPPNITEKDYLKWVTAQFQVVDMIKTDYWVSRTKKAVPFPARLFVLKPTT